MTFLLLKSSIEKFQHIDKLNESVTYKHNLGSWACNTTRDEPKWTKNQCREVF